jgi:hypothetical protein
LSAGQRGENYQVLFDNVLKNGNCEGENSLRFLKDKNFTVYTSLILIFKNSCENSKWQQQSLLSFTRTCQHNHPLLKYPLLGKRNQK